MSLTHSSNNYLVNDIIHGNVAWPSMGLESKSEGCTDALSSSIVPNHHIDNIFHSINNNNHNMMLPYPPPQAMYTYLSAQSNVIPSNNYSLPPVQPSICTKCNQQCHCESNTSFSDTNTFTINTLNTITLQHKTQVNQLNETISVCKSELARIQKQQLDQQRQIEEQQSKIKMLLAPALNAMDYREQCPTMHLSYEIIQKYLNVPSEFMNPVHDKCFCSKCHTVEDEPSVLLRGNPPQKYSLPLGWVRFGLRIDGGKCKMNNVFDDWNIAFHGTSRETAEQIFKSGLNLLKPGDYTIDGLKLLISDGHIRDCIWRRNFYLNQNEWFDPNQIFVTPSIIYAANEIYAQPFYCFNDTLKVQCVFQLMIRPNCYGIGQETINATKQRHHIDDAFNNNELEWYTKENVGIVVHALLVKITSINDQDNTKHDPMYIDLT
eukprot:130210_1